MATTKATSGVIDGGLTVAQGGTGVSTLTDGGVLLGSGTGSVTAMAVLGDGELIVGDGTTDPVAESGSTLRTSIGLGTGNSPTFSGGTFAADITGLTINATGDTAAADNAAVGYTAAEGLVLTGQGSTNDVTIKNDADAEVMGVLTGTTTAAFTGDVTASGTVGVGTASAAAKLDIDQSSTTAAIPVLRLDQADISEEMISFNTTIGVGNAIEALGTKVITTTHFIKITIGTTVRYIPVGTIAEAPT